MFISSCKPGFDLLSLLENNPLLIHFKSQRFHLTLYNRGDEIPNDVHQDFNISVKSGYENNRPTIAEMLKDVQFPCVICNSDIEFVDMGKIEKVCDLSFDIASGGRRDYQWDKTKSKFQGRQTLDYFIINSQRGMELMSDLEMPLGTVKIDNKIISDALSEGLRVLDVTKQIKVFHKNHESFKISGRFNLDINARKKSNFQADRESSTNYRFGSLHYARNVLSLGDRYLVYNVPFRIKRFRYFLGRLRIVLENTLEKKISGWLVKENREIIGFRYFLFIYIPRYK